MTVLVIMIVYGICSSFLGGQIISKTNDAEEIIKDTSTQMSLVEEDDKLVLSKEQDYKDLIANLEDVNSELENKRSRKNQIPTLLNQIVYIIPKSVQLTKITNTNVSDEKQHIIITAQSKQYEQLAYFKAKINNNGYLKNVSSTEGTKQGEYVVVIIEGDLP